MKRFLIALAVSAALLAPRASAEEILRSSYRYNGYTYVSSELAEIPCDRPFWERLEYVVFPDNTYAYVLHINFEGKTGYNIPKGVKMAVTTTDGKIVRADQIVAGTNRSFEPEGRGKVYWSDAQYLFTEADLTRILGGIKSLDVITGWEPDDYFQVNFKDGTFAETLSAQYEAIKAAPLPEDEVDSGDIVRYADNNASITVLTRAQVAKGEEFLYNVALNYLFYKNSNKEDYDLNFMLGADEAYDIPVGTPVVFTLADGSTVALAQEREQAGVVYCYPTADQVKALCGGVQSVSIALEGGNLDDTFVDDSFSAAVGRLYRTLMAVAVL